MLGIRYEKEGNIEDAVKVYEENIAMRSNGRHAYDRLKIIYRRQKDRENEIRVLRVAIGVFGEDSEYNERLLKLLSKTKEPFNAEKRPYFRASSLCSIKYPSAKQNAVKWKFGKIRKE